MIEEKLARERFHDHLQNEEDITEDKHYDYHTGREMSTRHEETTE